MTMTPEQSKAFRALQHALSMATECELFDLMAAHSHPDRINAFCDDFDSKLDSIKSCKDYPKQTNEHNALADAKWNFELYKFLNNI